MNDKNATGSKTQRRLQTLLDEYRRRVAAGEALEPRQFFEEHTDLGDEDRAHLAAALRSHSQRREAGHQAEPSRSDQEKGSAAAAAAAGEDSPAGRTTLPPKPAADDSADQQPSHEHQFAAKTPDAAPAEEPPETTYYQSSTASETLHPRAGEADNPATASSGEVPEQFGRYRITQCIGHGAMGSVYLAEDTQLDRRVALKIPKFRADDSHEFLERFRREAKAAATLRHANLCPVYDVGEINGVHYLSMAYIEGQPLSKLIGRDASQPESEVVHIVHRLASALDAAHSEGVIHRDLKPANIMIDQNGEPIIMDFGLARRVDKDDIKLTHSGAIMGSPAYMSPEQVEGDPEKMGPGCDIYSVGVIFYELLTGRVPFQGSVGAVLGQILSKKPRPPSELRPGLDPRLEAICLKMLAKTVEDRFQSMRDVIAALSELPESPSSFQRVRRARSVRRDDSRLDESAKAILAGRFPAWMIWTGVFVVIAAFGLTWALLALTLRLSNEGYRFEVDTAVKQAIEGGDVPRRNKV